MPILVSLSPSLLEHRRREAIFEQVGCLEEPEAEESQKTRINQRKVNNYKILNVQGLGLCFNSNSSGEYHEYDLR